MLNAEHVFHFYGPISSTSFENLRNCILKAIIQNGCKKATILLSSEGGDINSGFTAYNFLRSLPITLSIVNMGTIESMAIMMYLAADDRATLPTSRFLLHSFHWNFGPGNIDFCRVAECSDSLAFDVNRYAAIFNERTQGAECSIDISECLYGAARVLDVSSAIAAGITTRILPTNWTFPGIDATHWWPIVCC